MIAAIAPRHSFASRFLATVISQKVMVAKTWNEIHAAIAEDCYTLYFDGIKVASFTLIKKLGNVLWWSGDTGTLFNCCRVAIRLRWDKSNFISL